MKNAMIFLLVLCVVFGTPALQNEAVTDIVSALTGALPGATGSGTRACLNLSGNSHLISLRGRARGESEPAFLLASVHAGGPPALALITCILQSGEASPRVAAAAALHLWPESVSLYGTEPKSPDAAVDALLAAMTMMPAGLLAAALRGAWVLLSDVTAMALNPERASSSHGAFLLALATRLAGDGQSPSSARLREAGSRLANPEAAAAAAHSASKGNDSRGIRAADRRVHSADVQALAAAMGERVLERVVAALGAEAVGGGLAIERDIFGRTPLHMAASTTAAAVAHLPKRAAPLVELAHAVWLNEVSEIRRNSTPEKLCDYDLLRDPPLTMRDTWGFTAADVEEQVHGGSRSIMGPTRALEMGERRRSDRFAAAKHAACWLAAENAGSRTPIDSIAAAFGACLRSTAADLLAPDVRNATLVVIRGGKKDSGPAAAAVHTCWPLPSVSQALPLSRPPRQLQSESLPQHRLSNNGGWVEAAWLPPKALEALAAVAALAESNKVTACPARVIDLAGGDANTSGSVDANASMAAVVADGEAAVSDDDSVDHSALAEEAIRALTAGEPLILRGFVGRAWPQLAAQWALPDFLRAHGMRPFPAGRIPYAGVFGSREARAPLAALVLGMLYCNPGGAGLTGSLPASLRALLPTAAAASDDIARLCAVAGVPHAPGADDEPQYIFNRALEGATKGDDAGPLLAAMPIPRFLVNATLSGWAGAAGERLLSDEPAPPSRQLFAGAAGSGAPMHYHLDAANVLLYGEKRWFLQPPAAAQYSTQLAADYVRGLAAGAGATAEPPAMCTQRAGDVFIVPRGWGHAILNTATSVGYAVEFSTPLRRY